MHRTAFLFVLLLLLVLSGCAGTPSNDRPPLPTRSTATLLDDKLIETTAADRIYADAQMARNVHVNVTSFNHVVLLTGEALSDQWLRKVLDIVRYLPKVQRVHNELRVKDLTGFTSRAKDVWISTKLRARLAASDGVDVNRVKLTTEEGSVYLLGMVSRAEGQRAAEIASHIDGVQRVIKLFEYVD